MALTRREFLCRSFGAMGAAAVAFERFGLLKAFAQSSDYKALVCIFLFGGSDTGNVVIPIDDYADYATARQSAGLAIPKSSLLQITPRSGGTFGLHPSLTSPTGGVVRPLEVNPGSTVLSLLKNRWQRPKTSIYFHISFMKNDKGIVIRTEKALSNAAVTQFL